MSFLDKVMFWKKKDEFNFNDNFENQPQTTHQGNNNNFQFNDPTGMDNSKDSFMNQDDDFINPRTSRTKDYEDSEDVNLNKPFKEIKKNNDSEKDIELISSKLDTIKAELDSIKQRVINIEKNTGENSEKKKLW